MVSVAERPEAHSPAAQRPLVRYARIVLERRWLALSVFVATMAAFAVWASRTPRIYQATATILVDAMPLQIVGGDVMAAPGQFFAMHLQTQKRILTSDAFVRVVIERLHLANDAEFWVDGVPGDTDDAVQRLAGALVVEPVFQTQLLSISLRHRDPRQAKRAVDGLVDTYIEASLEHHTTSNADASRWLAEQADSLRQRLSKSEIELHEFKQKNDLLSVSLEDRINNVSQQIDRLSAGLTEARMRKAARAAEAEELDKMVAADPFAVVPASAPASLLEQKRRLSEEEQRLSELQARYEAQHPLVEQQLFKVKAAKATLLRETQLVVHSARARRNEVAAEEHKIAGLLSSVKQEGMRVSRLEVDYNRLKRDSDLLSRQYELVASRMKETELASRSEVNNVRVLDYARAPRTAVTPNLARDTPLAVLGGLVLAVALALAASSVDRRVKTKEDVENRLAQPVLAAIPHVRRQGYLTVADDPMSPEAELYRLVRTNLQFAGKSRSLRRVLLTSAMPQEGKTFTSLNLGAVMALGEDRKVLVIDCNLRRPSVALALGMEKAPGLTDVILGTTSLEETIQPTRVPNLSVLCAGPVPPSPADLLDGRKLQEILDACSERFDWILIDSPPAAMAVDSAILAKLCDGVIVVARSSRTTYAQLERALRALTDVGATLLGVVLNGTNARTSFEG